MPVCVYVCVCARVCAAMLRCLNSFGCTFVNGWLRIMLGYPGEP